MSSDEEYLDDLLKAVMEKEEEAIGEVSETASESNGVADIMSEKDLANMMSADELAELINSVSDSDELEALMNGMDMTGMDETAVEDMAEQAVAERGDETVELEDLALDDFGSMGSEYDAALERTEDVDNEFALHDIGEEETDSALAFQDVGEEESDNVLAIQDTGEEEADNELAIQDTREEEADNEFALHDIWEEEADNEFALHDIGEEETDSVLAIQDTGEEESDNELAIQDTGEEAADNDFAIHDIGEEVDTDFAIHDIGEDALLDDLISEDEVDALFAASDDAVVDNVPHTEEDMLAMLESMSMNLEDSDGEAADAQKESGDAEKKKGKSKKAKKGAFKRFGGKNKAEQVSADGDAMDEGEETAQEGAKNQSFFSKVVAFLVEADEDEEEMDAEAGITPSDENKNILAELDEEDKKKKKKKVKGKKGKVEEATDEENEDGEPVKEKKEKKKKKKKEKINTADALAALEDTKPKKRVSKKNVAVIAGLCLTMTAMIVVLCSIIPGFFDKRKARDAFYHSEYTKSYELLYGKELDNSDTIIFNKSKIILELNRKLDAYHNYLAIGKEVQALDALMAGIQKYPDILLEAEEYHVTQEVDAIYETMLNIISDKYGISESMAKEIISYDDLTYTRKLESIVNGTPFEGPTAEVWSGTEDLLPEEQDIVESTVRDVAETENVSDEEELPMGESSNRISDESVDATNEDEVLAEEMQLPISGGEVNHAAAQDTVVVQEESSDSAATSSGSQGELIQGIRQPISVEIHGR